jgi:copper resistance protein C
MRFWRVLVAISIACLTVAAHAHAFLDHAVPKVGSAVASAPSEVKIWFTQELEPAFSTAEVTDANGKRAASAPAHVDPHDPLVLAVPLAKLSPGEYTVSWRAVSVDTHVTEGRFTFQVGH